MKEFRDKIASMLYGEALKRANRRRATFIDATDLEHAFDEVVNPILRPGWLDVIADLCNFAGGAFTGYAINILTNDKPDYTRFALAGVAGVLLCGVAVAYKNLKPGR